MNVALDSFYHQFCLQHPGMSFCPVSSSVRCAFNGKSYDARNRLHIERFVQGKQYKSLLRLASLKDGSRIACPDFRQDTVMISVPRSIANRASVLANALALHHHLCSSLQESFHTLGEALKFSQARLAPDDYQMGLQIAASANLARHANLHCSDDLCHDSPRSTVIVDTPPVSPRSDLCRPFGEQDHMKRRRLDEASRSSPDTVASLRLLLTTKGVSWSISESFAQLKSKASRWL